MARGLMGRLLPLGIVAGAGYFLYAKGEQEKTAGTQSGLAAFAGEIDSLLGNINKPGTGGSSGGAPPLSGPTVGGGVYTGSAAQITALAQAAGVTSAADPRADQYGAMLWSLQSGNPMSAFSALPQATRATFDSVAVTGH